MIPTSALLLALAGGNSPDAPRPDYVRPPESHVTIPHLQQEISTPRGRGGWYIQLGAGLVTTEESGGPGEEIDFDEGYAVPIAIGHRFADDGDDALAFDLELEGIWTDQDTDDDGGLMAVVDVTQLGGLLNGIVNVDLGPELSFYGGAGIGLSFLDVGTTSDAVSDFDEEDGPFLAWQAKTGLRWWSSDTVSWNVGYRFLNVDDAEIDDDLGAADFDLETQQHVLEVGVRFQL